MSNKIWEIIDSGGEIMLIYEVSTVTADGLAPLGAEPSAGTALIKFGSCMNMMNVRPEAEGLFMAQT